MRKLYLVECVINGVIKNIIVKAKSYDSAIKQVEIAETVSDDY